MTIPPASGVSCAVVASAVTLGKPETYCLEGPACD